MSYAGPGLAKQPIPEGAYRRVPAGGGPPAGTGTGLRAEYFNNRELSGAVVVSRTEASVDGDWGDGSPVGGAGRDDFSVRWSGQVEAPVSGEYVFSTVSDDGVRLWVNGVLVIDNWTGHAPTSNSGAGLALVGGRSTRFGWSISSGGARLLWAYMDQLGRSQLQFSDIRRDQLLTFGSQLPAGGYLMHIVYANGTHRTEKLLKLGR